jgi:AcrR family transcriptional regulator
MDGRREHLLDAARKLFSSRGFAATSTREIAAQAGCNLGLITHYFGSKEGLLAAVIEANFKGEEPEVAAVLGGPGGPREQLEGFVDLAIDHFSSERDLLRIVYRELIQSESPFLAKLSPPIDRMVSELADRICQLRRWKGSRRNDARLAAMALVGAIQFCFVADPLVSRVLGTTPKALRSGLKRVMRALFLGEPTGTGNPKRARGHPASKGSKTKRATSQRRAHR